MDNPESNFHLAWTTMLLPLSIPNSNIHRIRTELKDPQLIARDYENTIRSYFDLKKQSDKPRFDLVLLGLGLDGHTASLFPDGTPGASIKNQDTDRLVIAPWISHLKEFRFSLTPSALNQADQVIFLISGSRKAEIFANVLEKKADYPAQRIEPVGGRLTWLVDEQAARLLRATLNVRVPRAFPN
jgi:6-phosphogluconolactonase